MLRLTDPATGQVVPIATSRARVLTIGAGASDLGTLLATDTLRRTAELLGSRVLVTGVPVGWESVNVRPGSGSAPPDVVVQRPADLGGPPYGLEHRLAWLSGSSVEEASRELARWRGLVAAWAEEPSRPMCAQVQHDLLAALADDLDTRSAVQALRGSLELDLPPGCLFETWAWADRLLGLDLAATVGH